jgi:hypothetical protein
MSNRATKIDRDLELWAGRLLPQSRVQHFQRAASCHNERNALDPNGSRDNLEQTATTFLLEKRKLALWEDCTAWAFELEFHQQLMPKSLLEGYPYFKRNLADELAI